ncbi:uncharacterized protein JCM6883_002498 [Sporobolomyces salmoneus]|uniref:uncharacterized protein n=1 Tax=Sporobolomyces salmoneus TaxID=183962 RepID=UPI00317FECD5
MHLPDELLESIFSLIHEKSAEPSPESQQTFAALALTSKRFLPLSRSYLYYRPIPRASAATWAQALALYSSLSTPLGQLVVSLEGIVEYVFRIGTFEEPGPLSFQLRGFTKTFSFYHAIIESCPQLVKVELIFATQQHGSKLLKVLAKSKSTLKTVRFADSRNANTSYYLTAPLIRWALEQSQLGEIENLIVDNPLADLETSAQPSTNSALKSYTILRAGKDTLKGFLPRDSTSLESVLFGLSDRTLENLEVSWILKYLPTSLAKMDFRLRLNRTTHVPSIDEYLHAIVSVFPNDFSHFTSLTHLSLHSFDGPSLDLLDILSSSSGSTLVVLDFSGCKWVPAQSTSTSNAVPTFNRSTISSVVDPDELLVCLRKFGKLQRVHLGYLPTLTRQTYANLEELKEDGVELQWKPCARYSMCQWCGQRHQ